jgi:hypothetical protein
MGKGKTQRKGFICGSTRVVVKASSRASRISNFKRQQHALTFQPPNRHHVMARIGDLSVLRVDGGVR